MTPGQLAYQDWREWWEATCTDGSPMATWAELPDEIRDAWERSKAARILGGQLG